MAIIKFTKARTNQVNIVDYIMRESEAEKKRVIEGDEDIVKEHIKMSDYSDGGYYHMIVRAEKGYTDTVWDEVVQEIKNNILSPWEEDEYSLMAVQHDDNHIHVVIPKKNLKFGNKMKIFDWKGTTRDYQRHDRFRDYLNQEFFKMDKKIEIGVSDFDRAEYIESKNATFKKYTLESKKEVNMFTRELEKYLETLEVEGHIDTFEDVQKYTKEFCTNCDVDIKKYGYEVKRGTEENPNGYYMTVQTKESGKGIRIFSKYMGEDNDRNREKSSSNKSINRGREKLLGETLRERVREDSKAFLQRTHDEEKGAREKYVERQKVLGDTLKQNETIHTDTSIHVASGNRSDNSGSVHQKDSYRELPDTISKRFERIQRQYQSRTTKKKYRNKDTLEKYIQEKKRQYKEKKYSILQERIKASKSIDIGAWLKGMGADITEYTNYYQGKCPWRQDAHPSFGVRNTIDGWMWKDWSTGETGDILNLVEKIYGIKEIDKQLNIVGIGESSESELEKITLVNQSKSKSKSKFNDRHIQKMNKLEQKEIDYMKSRGIDNIPYFVESFEEYRDGMRFTYLGVKNDSGGFAIRNEKHKTQMGFQDVTSIDNGKEKTVVIEGFFDLMTAWNILKDTVNYVCLNSGANIKNALKFFEDKEVTLFKDKGLGGDKVRDTIQSEGHYKTFKCVDCDDDLNADFMKDRKKVYMDLKRVHSSDSHSTFKGIDF